MSDRLHIAALRPEDLLVLDFEFINLKPATGGGLKRVNDGEPALVIVKFCPQHIMEAAFKDNEAAITNIPIHAQMAGVSRLVFSLPDDILPLPLTLEALLNWEEWKPVLASGQPGQLPGELETAIEFPWRLILSPDDTARWSHHLKPLTLDSNTQIWRTDLTPGANIRALASVPGDPSSVPGVPPFIPSLFASDRDALVELTSSPRSVLPDARPITAESLSLSTLGAWAKLRGEWPLTPASPPQRPPLTKYEHDAAQGRDQRVFTIRTGFLCGTGHRAVIFTTTERTPVIRATVVGSPPFGTAAFLHQHTVVVVEEPYIDYGPMAEAYFFKGREMPLRSIRLVTRSAEVQSGTYEQPTWLLTSGPEPKPLFFKAVAFDSADNQISFQLPLMFVPLDKVWNITQILCTYHQPPFDFDTATRVRLHGQALAMASDEGMLGSIPGSMLGKAEEIQFGLATVGAGIVLCPPFGPLVGSPLSALDPNKLPSSYRPRHLPYITNVTASLPALDELLGSKDAHKLVYDLNYLENGFDVETNPGQTFVQLTTELPIDFPSQQGGGLVRPNTVIKALSRTFGAVSSPEALKEKKIDLSAFQNARFLGTIELLNIVKNNMSFDPQSDAQGQSGNQPRLITRRLGESVETRFVWKLPLVESRELGLLTLHLEGAELVLEAVTTRSFSGKGSSLVTGRLRGARFEFKNVIDVTFGELLFQAEDGRKMDVSAKNVALRFREDLEFVNSLRSILPKNGFEDPPFLTVDGQGVVAGYTLGLPSVAVGIFSLQNIALTAALSVPFVDKPAGVRFAISERHKPFLVTVSLFGGSGFFAMAVSAKGLEQIEAQIEFGGNISLNLVIASGGVYVMAGIYFGLTANSVKLTGYLRCGGYLEVLGLISVSVEFYLAFNYNKKQPRGNEVWGQASLTVCVDFTLFSKSVSLSVERHFAGSDGDPSFEETINPTQWGEYLQAFA